MCIQKNIQVDTDARRSTVHWVTAQRSNRAREGMTIRYYGSRRKFRSQTSDKVDRWKAEMGRVREKRRVEERRAEERRSEKRKSQKKEDAGVRKGRKVAKHCVSLMTCGSGGSTSRLRWEMRNCTPLWREAHFQVKMYKTPHARTTFGSCDVKKVHAVVARSTFGSQDVQSTRGLDCFWKFRSQNAQSTPCSDHFWKLRCRKSACRCGAKHISKSKC